MAKQIIKQKIVQVAVSSSGRVVAVTEKGDVFAFETLKQNWVKYPYIEVIEENIL